jgi:hypothetical protein
MVGLISRIVDSAISHAEHGSTNDRYDWPTTREALARILSDLEARDRDATGLDRLRTFIAGRDSAWAERNVRTEDP